MATNYNFNLADDRQNTKLTLRVYVLTTILVLTAFSLTAVVFYFGRNMENDRKLFVDSILKMRLDVTSAHLIYDEIIHHEKNGRKYDHVPSITRLACPAYCFFILITAIRYEQPSGGK